MYNDALDQHRRILGILFIVANGLTLLAVVLASTVFGVFGLLAAGTEGGGEGAAAMFALAVLFGGCLLLTAVPGLIAGIGLLKRKPWARVLALVLGILALPNVPLGTALGIYAIWFFAQQGSPRVFE